MQNTQDLLLNSESLSEFLRKEYLRRLERNSKYSLRAFARDLELSPSRLSETLNFNKGFSQTTLQKISTQLKLTQKAQSYLRDLSLSQSHKNRGVRSQAQLRVKEAQKIQDIKKLDAEKFKVISDWYHTAIIELTELKNFQSDISWIAEKLSISHGTAQAAVDRLIHLGLLTLKEGRLQATPEILATSSQVPSSAIRKFHRQMISKAYRSLQEDPMELRDLNSMILAVPQNRMPEFREQIQLFLKKFWEETASFEKVQLYALNVQFFPLTQKTQKKDSQ